MRKDIGVDAEPPQKQCGDRRCPWCGTLSVRGRSFIGTVKSSKPANTCIVSWDYYNYVRKYERYERRNTKVAAHNPSCISAKAGDTVRIMECRPLSKSKKFVVIEKYTSPSGDNSFGDSRKSFPLGNSHGR